MPACDFLLLRVGTKQEPDNWAQQDGQNPNGQHTGADDAENRPSTESIDKYRSRASEKSTIDESTHDSRSSFL